MLMMAAGNSMRAHHYQHAATTPLGRVAICKYKDEYKYKYTFIHLCFGSFSLEAFASVTPKTLTFSEFVKDPNTRGLQQNPIKDL